MFRFDFRDVQRAERAYGEQMRDPAQHKVTVEAQPIEAALARAAWLSANIAVRKEGDPLRQAAYQEWSTLRLAIERWEDAQNHIELAKRSQADAEHAICINIGAAGPMGPSSMSQRK